VSTAIEAELHQFHDWIFRFRPATTVPPRLLVLLHGRTGDENSMWVFARKLPSQAAILAPRALYAAPEGGFIWHRIQTGTMALPVMEDLRPSAEALIGFVDEWSRTVGMSTHQFDLVGFSEGAALSYTLALIHPERIRTLAALSGFIPSGMEELLVKRLLEGKDVFIAHGKQDNMIPVEQARRSVGLLESAGARVRFCESDGGHKVSAVCLRELTEIFGDE
jgi:phospholipase/carboxylesterase